MDRLTPKEMIQAIKSNYPDASRYSMLCEALIHAIELLQAESEGRLIVLPPCRCGDTLYYILDGKIYEGTVYHIQYDDYHGTISSTVSASLHGGYSSVAAGFDDFGKTVFLSREEAEAALGGGEDG